MQMPAHPSRTPPTQRQQQQHTTARAAAAFTPDDVSAFRLRPLGQLNTPPPHWRNAAATRAVSTSLSSPIPPPLPTLVATAGPGDSQRQRGNSKTLREEAGQLQQQQMAASSSSMSAAATGFAASYPASKSPITTAAAPAARGAGYSHNAPAGAITVPAAAVPQVYAALIPRSVAAEGLSVCSPTSASSSPLNEAASTTVNADVVGEKELDIVPPPAPDGGPLPPPNLREAEARELTQWTQHATLVTTAPAAHRSTRVVEVASTALTSADAATLHRWWRERSTVRLHHRHAAELTAALSPVIEGAVRSTLTAEEAYWQQQRRETHARGILTDAPAHTAVPAGNMEALMRAVQLVTHQTAITCVEAQLAADKDEDEEAKEANNKERMTATMERSEEDVLSTQQRAAVLTSVLVAQRTLLQETKAAESALTTPSVATLPPDTPIPPPVLRMEAAVAATLLARILEQAEATTPGIGFAHELLHRFLLPHLYTDYTAWAAVRPVMGTLSEQVTHLATLPLRVHQQHAMVAAATQAQADTRYLQAVVKAWAMRSWLRYVTGERQRVAHCAAVGAAFHRLQSRLQQQRIVTHWRQRLQQRQQQRQAAMMEAEYQRFLRGSQAAGAHLLPHRTAVMPAGALIPTATPPQQLPPQRQPSSIVPALLSRKSTGLRKKGAGHSRVYVSFIRRKPSGAGTSAGASEATESEVERYTVRNTDSDVDDDDDEYGGESGEDASGERNSGYTARYAEGDVDTDVGDGYSEVPLLTRGGRPSTRSLLSGFSAGGGGGGGAALLRAASGVGGNGSLMYLEAPKADAADIALPPPLPLASHDAVHRPRLSSAAVAGGGGIGGAAAPAAQTALFTTMLATLREMEGVNAYLRKELAVQARRVRKAVADNAALRQRNSELEAGTLVLVREKLEACNLVQQQSHVIAERGRQIRLLRSRLRAHRHRPWQQAVMRLVGDVCAVSTAEAERMDEMQVRSDRYGTQDSEAAASRQQQQQQQQQVTVARWGTTAPSADGAPAVGDGAEPLTAAVAVTPAPPVEALTDEERLFGRIAPIVLHSARQLPDARLILRDWANSCLDDLQRLDEQSRSPLSARFASFSEEARSGVLLSRLLYYLALPRYRAQTSAAADATVDGSLGNRGAASASAAAAAMMEDMHANDAALAGMDPRRVLLGQQGVQLDPPYPVYDECFSDVLNLPPAERMAQLLQFATELLTSHAGDPIHAQWEATVPDSFAFSVSQAPRGDDGRATPTAEGETDKAAEAGASAGSATSPPHVPLPLNAVVDPFALARGEAAAVVTFVALLYVRFAHPFHHKCRHSAAEERKMLLQLWSGGDATAAELAGPSSTGGRSRHGNGGDGAAVGESVSDDSLVTFLPCEEEGGTASGERETATAAQGAAPTVEAAATSRAGGPSAAAAAIDTGAFSIEKEMLQQLSAEDKTPWQLFRERCLPVFGTHAHPFLLRGGFWPAEAFDTPELAAMLGALAMALRRSLELHRWHITISCLVPVRTYSGLTRGVFTGPNASPAALQLGLRQDQQAWLSLAVPPVQACVAVRQAHYQRAAKKAGTSAAAAAAVVAARPQSLPSLPSFGSAATATRTAATVDAMDEIDALTKAVTGVWQEDLLALFTQRALLSPQLGLPVLDLGGWRLLCRDLGLIDMSSPDHNAADPLGDPRLSPGAVKVGAGAHASPATATMPCRTLDMEVVTFLFQAAVMAVSRARGEVDPAVFVTSMTNPVHTRRQREAEASSDDEGEKRGTVSMDYVMDVAAAAPAAALPAVHSTERAEVSDIEMDMTYAAFVVAMVLLADAIFPSAYFPRLVTASLSPPSMTLDPPGSTRPSPSPSRGSAKALTTPPQSPMEGDAITLDPTDAPPTSRQMRYCTLPMAFAEMMRCVILASPLFPLQPQHPRSVLRRLTSGTATQMVLLHNSPALLLVYQTYSKEVLGEPGMLREDLLRLLRDAMLTSTELSQYLVFDLFANCAVLRLASEEAAAAARKGKDGRLRTAAASAATAAASRTNYRAVRVVEPGNSMGDSTAAAAQRRRAHVLTFEGFCELICVLCGFKQPNVFVPFEDRLSLFVRRSLLRPLSHSVPGLGQLLMESQAAQDGHDARSAVTASALPKKD